MMYEFQYTCWPVKICTRTDCSQSLSVCFLFFYYYFSTFLGRLCVRVELCIIVSIVVIMHFKWPLENNKKVTTNTSSRGVHPPHTLREQLGLSFTVNVVIPDTKKIIFTSAGLEKCLHCPTSQPLTPLTTTPEGVSANFIFSLSHRTN